MFASEFSGWFLWETMLAMVSVSCDKEKGEKAEESERGIKEKNKTFASFCISFPCSFVSISVHKSI